MPMTALVHQERCKEPKTHQTLNLDRKVELSFIQKAGIFDPLLKSFSLCNSSAIFFFIK